MAEEHSDMFKKSQEFLQMLGKQKDFIQDLLKENERLGFRSPRSSPEAGMLKRRSRT